MSYTYPILTNVSIFSKLFCEIKLCISDNNLLEYAFLVYCIFVPIQGQRSKLGFYGCSIQGICQIMMGSSISPNKTRGQIHIRFHISAKSQLRFFSNLRFLSQLSSKCLKNLKMRFTKGISADITVSAKFEQPMKTFVFKICLEPITIDITRQEPIFGRMQCF